VNYTKSLKKIIHGASHFPHLTVISNFLSILIPFSLDFCEVPRFPDLIYPSYLTLVGITRLAVSFYFPITRCQDYNLATVSRIDCETPSCYCSRQSCLPFDFYYLHHLLGSVSCCCKLFPVIV
jgi:hypothetical protein